MTTHTDESPDMIEILCISKVSGVDDVRSMLVSMAEARLIMQGLAAVIR